MRKYVLSWYWRHWDWDSLGFKFKKSISGMSCAAERIICSRTKIHTIALVLFIWVVSHGWSGIGRKPRGRKLTDQRVRGSSKDFAQKNASKPSKREKWVDSVLCIPIYSTLREEG